jgi:hypothetical protein
MVCLFCFAVSGRLPSTQHVAALSVVVFTSLLLSNVPSGAYAIQGEVPPAFHGTWVPELRHCGRSFSHRHVRVAARGLLRGPNLFTGRMETFNATTIQPDDRDPDMITITFPSANSDSGFETFRWQIAAGRNSMTMQAAKGNTSPARLFRCAQS